jgi:hypothetical protein
MIIFFLKYIEKIRVIKILHEKTCTLPDQCTFIIISRSVLLKMRNVSDKSCRENRNTHFMFNNFLSENRAVFEIMWKNIVEPDSLLMTVWRMRIACWITKATDTRSHNTQYPWLFHRNNYCTKAPKYYVKGPIHRKLNRTVKLCKKNCTKKTELNVLWHSTGFPIRFVFPFFVSSVCLLVRVTMADKKKAVVCCLLATSAIMLPEKTA